MQENEDDVAKLKLKTHRGAAKRFKKTGGGQFTRAAAYRRHLLTGKPTKRKRRARGRLVVDEADRARLARMLPYE